MAGLIAALFGGRTRPADPDPLPGLGGYAQGAGPSGENGFPGSTSRTRSFQSRNPRHGVPGDWTTIKADTNYGFDQALSTTVQNRQASYRGDITVPRTQTSANPRLTSRVSTPQPQMTVDMQSTPGTNKGGPALKVIPGTSDTTGGELTSEAVASGGGPMVNSKDTTTLWKDAQPVISVGVPGSNDVRNQIAQRYKNKPGQTHTYWAAYRADQAQVNPTGQASDGNVQIHEGQQQVSVQNRFVFPGGGNLTWAVLRQMPYTGRGNGARGAELNGQRRYATGQQTQFWNAGQGDYGVARLRGSQNKRPVGFTEPAPWTANFYDTTDSVGTSDNPNSNPAQAPDMIYVSPNAGRATNSTGRTG